MRFQTKFTSLTDILLYEWLVLCLSLLLLPLSELIQPTLIKEDLWTWHWIKAERINSSHIEFSPLLRGPQLRRPHGTAAFHNRQNSCFQDSQYSAEKGKLNKKRCRTFPFLLDLKRKLTWNRNHVHPRGHTYTCATHTGRICAPASHPFTLCHNETRGWCKPQQQI